MKKMYLLLPLALLLFFKPPVIAQWAATAFDISPLLIGEKVPDVMLTDTKGNQQSIVALTKEKPTVVIFYRGDWCSNCITHFSGEIAPVASQISDLGYNMIAISPDAPDTLIKTSQKTGLTPEMFFQDGDGSLSTAMGIAFQQSERSLARLDAYSGGKNKGFLPVPGVFVLNTNQEIIFEYINPNGPNHLLRIRGKFLVAVLQALNEL